MLQSGWAWAAFLLGPFFSSGNCFFFSFSCSILVGRTREGFWKDLQTGFQNLILISNGFKVCK
jgi:hypothetical protein